MDHVAATGEWWAPEPFAVEDGMAVEAAETPP